MNAKLSDWLRLCFSLVASAVATIALALMMNLTGDCGPGIENCGETARRLSYVVLALGSAWLIYLAVRFFRDHRACDDRLKRQPKTDIGSLQLSCCRGQS